MKHLPQPLAYPIALTVLLANSSKLHQRSGRLKALCELLEQYPMWDKWRAHPYCFLSTEECCIVERYLHYGSEAAIVEFANGGATYINTLLNRAIRKLEAGRADYAMVAAYLKSHKPVYDWDVPALILERPFVLFGFSAHITNCLLRSSYNNFREMEEDQGIAVFLNKVYGIGEGGFSEIRVAFERYDLHGLLRPLELCSEYAHLNIVSHLNSAAG